MLSSDLAELHERAKCLLALLVQHLLLHCSEVFIHFLLACKHIHAIECFDDFENLAYLGLQIEQHEFAIMTLDKLFGFEDDPQACTTDEFKSIMSIFTLSSTVSSI